MENIEHDARQMGKTSLTMQGVRAEALRIIDPEAQEIAPRLSAEEDRQETDRYREAQSAWLREHASRLSKQEAKKP